MSSSCWVASLELNPSQVFAAHHREVHKRGLCIQHPFSMYNKFEMQTAHYHENNATMEFLKESLGHLFSEIRFLHFAKNCWPIHKFLPYT